MYIDDRAKADMRKVNAFALLDSEGEPTYNTRVWMEQEYRQACRSGVERVHGYNIRDEDDNVIGFEAFEHEVWRCAGMPTPEAMTALKNEVKGRVERAFPYLFFSLQEDALMWRLRQDW